MTDSYRIFVGIDWGARLHQVSVTDATGAPLGERQVAHDGAALTDLCEWLIALAGTPAAVAVALEVPRGPIVDTLLERGCHVFALNPKQLDRFRDRFTVAGAKDDRRDADVLSSSLRTDRDAFRSLAVEDPLTLQLREAVRQDLELGEDLRRVANRLRDLLVRTWPELLQLAPAADERWLWALLKLAPTPDEAARLRRSRLQRLLQAHQIRRFTLDQLCAVVRTPSVYVAAGVRRGVQTRMLMLVEQAQLLHAQRREAERELAKILDALPAPDESREHRDVTILQSLPALGTRIAATMLAEAARPLRDRDYHALRTLIGIAPVTRQSGKSRVVTMRYACHRQLQNAVFFWSRGLVQHDLASKTHYRRLRAAGHSEGRALRGVADRMLKVMIAMLVTGQLYDASRRHKKCAA